MFTGIVKGVGRIEKIIREKSSVKLAVRGIDPEDEVKISDSVAVNGVCLTVTKKDKDILFFAAIKSSLEVSNLKRLKMGDYVNLELALKMGERLGGHFVLGHVDGEVKIKQLRKIKDYWQLEVDLKSIWRKFVIENGSVALEGISLTVKKIFPRSITVNVILFTYEHTNLKYKKVGDWINIEFDHLLKTQMVADRKNADGRR